MVIRPKNTKICLQIICKCCLKKLFVIAFCLHPSGNQLGEDGIEVIRATMESIDLLDRLGPFRYRAIIGAANKLSGKI